MGGLHELDGYSVPAFDRSGAIGAAAAVALVGHPPGGLCYEVRTAYGRSVRVTGDHSLFVAGPGRPGAPQARTVSELRTGDRIAIAGRIDVPTRDRHAVELADVWDAQGRDPWLLDVRVPGLGDLAYQHRNQLFAAFLAYGATNAKDCRRAAKARVRTCIDRHQLPLGALRKLALPIPTGATVRVHGPGTSAPLPATVGISNELLWLLGLYTANGCRYDSARDAFVTITAPADTLDRAEKVVERDLDLHVARNGDAVYVHSRLLLTLLDHLGFTAGPKGTPGWVLGLPLSRLKWFVDGLFGTDPAITTTSAALKDDVVVALARFGLVPTVRRAVLPFPSWQVSMVNVQPPNPLAWDRGVTQDLDAPRTGDIVWATVTAIEEVAPTPLVYDFCVPGRENFYAGTGVMCHNTYGPHMRPDDGRAVSNFLVQALAGEPLTVYGDGNQTRSFCYVEDEVRGLLALLDSDYVGPVNIGNPNEFTILELAKAVLDVTGSPSELHYEPLPVDDPTQRRPDITLARRLLHWEPTVDLAAGLARTAEWFRRG
ncbi:MAG: NAD-dependent epimerase/dehydratase family protein [Acidimicrobiales bacterium]